MGRFGSRWLAPAGAVAVLAILMIGVGGAGASSTTTPPAEPHTTLLTLPLLDAIAANSTNVYAQAVTNCSQIWTVNAWGNESLYATVSQGTHVCSEGALALAPLTICPTSSNSTGNLTVAPRLGEWGNGGGGGKGGGGKPSACNPPEKSRCGHQSQSSQVNLFDVLNGVLFEISDNGANVTPIATFSVPNTTAENMGLAYDQVGLFNHDLIVTSSSLGQVWLVNQTGNVTLLTSLNTYIGGPAVAPMSFGSYGGDIVLAAKTWGTVVAITPTGNTTTVADWQKSNAVTFPSANGWGYNSSWSGGWGNGWHHGGWGGCNACSFGANHDVLFVANYSSGALEAFPASDLVNFTGQGFVAGGLNHGIASFASNGTTTLFQSQTERLSDIASVSCFPGERGYGGWGGWGWGWSPRGGGP